MSADVKTRAAIETVVLFTHRHPEQTGDAVRATVDAVARQGGTVVASPEERAKHGESAVGCEEVAQLPGRPELEVAADRAPAADPGTSGPEQAPADECARPGYGCPETGNPFQDRSE